MRTAFVRRIAPLTGALMLVMTACGPSDLVGGSKLGAVKDGATTAEVATIIGEGPLKPLQAADTLRIFHGYRTQMFLAQGERYQVIWYREKPGSIEDPITREVETPILVLADKVVGHGWSFYDDKSAELGIPNPLRAKERLDSISQSQMPKAK